MTDYGHDLQFGSFLTPAAVDPVRVVELAVQTEVAGLDLVTVQDHPYNSQFLDTWTLLSWIAARTERVRLAGNVLNLPLRPPAVLARAAASLDLLSGGRVELGLGAGAFWDPIVAMGGERRTAAEAVTALDEAIDVIRGIWDEHARGGVRVAGEHYRVAGAKRGPAPAHDIAIWLGAYKPRMLRLVGTKADGWLPSLGYLKPDDFAASQQTIDTAATAAGRDPRQIRRLLNVGSLAVTDRRMDFLQGPVDQLIQELAELVLNHGFSTFIAGEDPRTLEILGAEIAPAVRDLVARERRATDTATGPARGPAVIALRHDDIDYDAIPSSLQALSIEPGDSGYDQVRSTYVWHGSPGLVITPRTTHDVIEAVRFARTQPGPMVVRSGGHGISGRSTSDSGIVIDLQKLNRITVLDAELRLVRVEAGARWGEVARELAPHGLAISSGDYGDVGAGGLATTGGIGYLGRKYGLTIDHLTAAEIVLADGSLVRTDAETESDLFWAIRGAGGNFGIVTAFEFEAEPVDTVAYASIAVDASDPAAVIENWGALVEAAPRELTSFMMMVPSRRGQAPMAQLTLVYAGEDVSASVDIAQDALTPFLTVGPVLQQSAQLTPYAAIVAPSGHQGQHGSSSMATRSGLLDHLSAPAARVLGQLLTSGELLALQFRSVGGAINDVDPDATAYPHRTQNFSVIATTATSMDARLTARWSELRPYLNGMYLSFETGTDPSRLQDAWPEPTLSRLRALKAKYDPDNVFDRNFAIPPAG